MKEYYTKGMRVYNAAEVDMVRAQAKIHTHSRRKVLRDRMKELIKENSQLRSRNEALKVILEGS